MAQRHRLLKFAANLVVGAVMVLLGVAMGYSVNPHHQVESINDVSPAIINTEESPDAKGYNILSA